MNKYVGIIEAYFETGMEYPNAQFHSNTGNHEGPKLDNPEETMIYRSLEHTIDFSKKYKYVVKIYNKEGTEVEYEGPLTYNRDKIIKAEYRISFVPEEVDLKTWITWLIDERKCELETDDRLLLEKDWYKPLDEVINEQRTKGKDRKGS